jgi:hypothetical protein
MQTSRGRPGRDRKVVRLITTYAISTLSPIKL